MPLPPEGDGTTQNLKLVQVSTCDQKSYLLEHTPFPTIPHIPSPPTPPQQWAITSQEM